jgi:S1-C subfamily serine protease
MHKWISVLSAALLVVACGGGRGDGSEISIDVSQIPLFLYQNPPVNQAPPAPNSQVATGVLGQTVLVIGGSGYFVRKNFILTNWHVVRGYLNGSSQTASVPVTLRNGTQQSATIVAFEQSSDIALLRIATTDSPDGLPFGKSHLLSRGNAVFTIGNRLQAGWVYLGGSFQEHSVTPIPCDGTAQSSREVVVFSGDVADGNSGGALFNAEGQVVGMVSCRSVSGTTGEVRGLAVPSETLTQWLNGIDWSRVGG